MTIHRTWHTLIKTIWNFNSLFRVCLIFIHTILRTSKSIGNNTMKKMLLATALALLITGCAQQTFTVQNKPAAVAPKGNHHPSFLRFWNLGRRNPSMQPKFVAAQKMLLKTETQQTSVKWIARFYYFRHLYSAGSACVLLNNCGRVAHRYGQLYLHCSLIYFWVPSSAFA